MARQESIIPINFGMRHDTNDLAEGSIYFDVIENGYIQDGKLHAEPYYLPYASVNELSYVDGYAVSWEVSNKAGYFGVKIGKSFYTLKAEDPEADFVELVKVGDFFLEDGKTLYTDYDEGTMQFATWTWTTLTTAYMTRKGLPLYKITLDNESNSDFGIKLVPPSYTITDIGKVYVSAKYILATKDRLFLGNLVINGTDNPTSILWSDLNNPEDFEITRNKEADIFDLGVNAFEVTGLAYSEGTVIVLSRNSIWRSDYEGHDTRFRTTMLTNNTGCAYHYSAITVNEVVYFIGKDNFYALKGLSLIPIGEAIWDWFKSEANLTPDTSIFAHYELRQDSVSWVFPRKSDDGDVPWAIKYNIKEGTWTTRYMQES